MRRARRGTASDAATYNVSVGCDGVCGQQIAATGRTGLPHQWRSSAGGCPDEYRDYEGRAMRLARAVKLVEPSPPLTPGRGCSTLSAGTRIEGTAVMAP